MNIPEAIENIMEIKQLDCHVKYPEWQDALSLGIEALKRLKEMRQSQYRLTFPPLPGETEGVTNENLL